MALVALRPPRSLLAVLDGGEDDARVLDRSCDLALRHDARLTVLRVWRPSPFVFCAVNAGVDPAPLIAESEAEAARSLREVVADLPAGLPCIALCRRQTFRRDVVGEALEAGVDCLIAGRRVLRRRQHARLRRKWPDLQILSTDESLPLRRSLRYAA